MSNTHRVDAHPHHKKDSSSPNHLGEQEIINHLIGHTKDILYRFELSPTTKFSYINPAITQIAGYSLQECYQNTDLAKKLFTSNDVLSVDKMISQSLQHEPYKLEIVCKDGQTVLTEHLSIPILNEEGKVVAIEGIARDITHRQQSSSNSEKVVSLLDSLSNSIPTNSSLYQAAAVIGNNLITLTQAEHCFLYMITPNNRLKKLWSDMITENGYKKLENNLESFVYQHKNKISLYEFKSSQLPNNGNHPIQPYTVCPMIYGEKTIAIAACLQSSWKIARSIDLKSLEIFCQHAAITIENVQLTSELQDAYTQSIISLAKTINARDAYTSDHSQKTMLWAKSVAQNMGFDERETNIIGWAALLHDIGKIGIPDNILNKPAELNSQEWQKMKKHPEIGASIISNIKMLQSAIPFIRFHHEHYDGKGYPNGLKGEQIPLGARILSVVDAYSAMIDERVYRPPRKPLEAINELKRQSGAQFDPQVVKAFIHSVYQNEGSMI